MDSDGKITSISVKFVHPFAVGKWSDVSKSNNNGSDDNNDDNNDDDKDSDDNDTEAKIQALKKMHLVLTKQHTKAVTTKW